MTARAPVRPVWGLAEIGLLAAVFVFGLWVVGPRVATQPLAFVGYWALTALGAAAILWLSPKVLHQDPPELRGWRLGGEARRDPGALDRAWPVYAAVTAAGAVGLIAVAVARDPQAFERLRWESFALKFAGYLVFGLVEAVIFFGFVQTRLRTALPVPSGPDGELKHQAMTVAATAAVFAAAHAPNLPLMAISFGAGLVWSAIYYRRPNVVLLAVSFAVLGTLLHRVVQLNMRIGPFFEDRDNYILRSAVPGLKALIGDLY